MISVETAVLWGVVILVACLSFINAPLMVRSLVIPFAVALLIVGFLRLLRGGYSTSVLASEQTVV